MALRHQEAFKQFVWSALRRAYNAYYDAMEQELEPEGVAQFTQSNVNQEPLMFKPSPPEAPPVVQRWWVFHVKALELSPEPLCDEVGEIVLHLAPLATMDPDKRRAILLSSTQRAELLPLAERLVVTLHNLEQIDPRSESEALHRALLPWWPTTQMSAREQASAGRCPNYGLKISPTMSTIGFVPLFSSQCVMSFPAATLSPSVCSLVTPPSRCSVNVPWRTRATAGRSL